MSLPAIYEPDSEYDDAALVHAHCAGDVDAFDALFRRYYHALVSWVEWRCHDHGRAEDVAQETLVAAVRYIGSFDPSRPIWPWLRTIAGHILGREIRASGSEALVERMPEYGVTASDDFDALDERALVTDALSRLSRRHQTALWLRYAEERTSPECASIMGISANGFNQLVWRARRLLRAELEAAGRGFGALAWLVPLSVRRLWRRTVYVRMRCEASVSASASFAALTFTVAGALVTGGALFHGGGVVPAHRVSLAARTSIVGSMPVGHTAAVSSPRVTARVAHHVSASGSSSGEYASTNLGARAAGGSVSAKVAKNPVRNGQQFKLDAVVDTPLGPAGVHETLTGDQGRIVCMVADCT